MYVKKYISIAKVNLINLLAYKFDFIFEGIFLFFLILVMVNIWSVIFSTKQVFGYTLNTMIYYFMFSECIVNSRYVFISKLEEEVKSGDVVKYLIKPYNIVFYYLSLFLSEFLFKFFTFFFLSMFITILFVGFPDFDILTLPLTLISVFLSAIFLFLMDFIIGLFAFWLEDIKGLQYIFSKAILVAGGVIFPLDIFPPFFKTLFEALPFASAYYLPAKLFVSFSWFPFIRVIYAQLKWILIFGFILAFIYSIAIKKVEINGG